MFSSTDETYFEVLDKSVSQFCKQAFNDAEFIASSVNSIIINADYIDSAFIRWFYSVACWQEINCFLLDNNGYVLVSENPDEVAYVNFVWRILTNLVTFLVTLKTFVCWTQG